MSETSRWPRRALAAVAAAVLLGVGLWVQRQYDVPVRIVMALVAFAIVLVLAPYEVWKRSKRRGAGSPDA